MVPREPAADYAGSFHVPVLCHAVVEALVTSLGGPYVDATLGGGGHTAALLDAGATVVGVDRDREAIDATRRRLSARVSSGQLRTIHGNFAELAALLANEGITGVRGLLLDLGVSSHQIDTARRGFSYRIDAPLDMRMSSDEELDAADIINRWSERELRQLLREYGEEPRAARIARKVVAARPVNSTGQLARIVRAAVNTRREAKTLSRVFQAVRIAVNDELRNLEKALLAAEHILERGGRMAVISYHSLEDRRVKRTFRHGNVRGEPVRDVFGTPISPWRAMTRRPITPDDREIVANPRARSARLRVAERTSTAATATTC